MEGDDRPQWPWKVAALVNGRIRGKEILLSLCRRAHRDKAQCLHSFSVPIPPAPSPRSDDLSAKGVRTRTWTISIPLFWPHAFQQQRSDQTHYLVLWLLPCSMNDNAGLSVGCLFGPPPWSRPKYLKKTIGWTAMNLCSDIQGPKENIRMTVAIPWLSL